jgi:hypothetical protein
MINLQNRIDEAKGDEPVREWRWPEGGRCPPGASAPVSTPGRDTPPPPRQKYRGTAGQRYVDDLTGTGFAGHPPPWRVWGLGLSFRGLNLSNPPIAQALGLNQGGWAADDRAVAHPG